MCKKIILLNIYIPSLFFDFFNIISNVILKLSKIFLLYSLIYKEIKK